MLNYRLYILAGTATQAADYMRSVGLMPSQVSYVAASHQLRGLSDPNHVIVGTFWDRHDALAIWAELLIACKSKRPVAPDHIEKFLDKKYKWTPTKDLSKSEKKEPVLPSKFKSIPKPEPVKPVNPVKPDNYGFKRIPK